MDTTAKQDREAIFSRDDDVIALHGCDALHTEQSTARP
jgi:hypothetical protein